MPMKHSMEGMEGYDDDWDSPGMHKDQHRSIDEEEAMHPASLVSLKVLTGKDGKAPKVGQEIVIRVVAIHGDEAEVEYAPEEPSEDESGDELEEINSSYG